jgi:ankyrin repeat protein
VQLRLTALLLALSAIDAAAGQLPARVEFVRDVQPIFREHCFTCHGPDQQMGGFRLDRRADALRGGSQSDIGPGNADGSRLYHRLIGTNMGSQMPPAGPLRSEQIDIVKQWIDEGAEWPDEASGEKPDLPSDPDATRFNALVRDGDAHALGALLAAKPKLVHAHGLHGTTPLMAAVLYGDAALVKRLLAAGADPNARNAAGATALMWATPDVEKIRLLLDAGADVNARSDDRRSPLVVTSGIVGALPALRTLLEYGADPSVLRPTDPSALRETVRVDAPDMFQLLLEYGVSTAGRNAIPETLMRINCARCAAIIGLGGPLAKQPPESDAAATAPRYDPGRSSLPTPIGATPATPASIRAAVERSLPLLQDIDTSFLRQTGCLSCHHNSLVSMTLDAARRNGFTIDEHAASAQMKVAGAYLDTWRERTLQNGFIAGQADTISYLLFGLAVSHYQPDAATDAQVLWLKRRQAVDGRWPLATLRPPIESNDVAVTAVSVRALQAFAPPSQRADYAAAVERARLWLETIKGRETEERAFRLLGLTWANASKEKLAEAARDLLSAQAADGGWAQRERMSSDAYATGEALVALHESGALPTNDPRYCRGLEFLLRTQFEDGTWFVESRSVPIQAYFDSGFPYGVNQWISAAATAWATTALALSR